MAKIDLADGYYRIPLSPSAALRLAALIPSDTDGPALVALPLTLPMGWSHSPPYFCAFTESVADVANSQPTTTLTTHPLYHATQTPPQLQMDIFHPDAIVLGSNHQPPLAYHDVYIDDFITLVQRPLHQPAMTALLNSIDAVFDTTQCPPRRPLISESKLNKDDASFSTVKWILGWDIDTHRMQLSLPTHRWDALETMLTTYLRKKRVSHYRWSQSLGNLRSSSPAIYGANHVFSILQHAATSAAHMRRFSISPLVRAVLRDWLLLQHSIHDTPAPLHSLVPRTLTLVATTDASQQGMGGAWSPVTASTPRNFLWRSPFPSWIQRSIITQHNPNGTLSINDLELTALLVRATLAAQSSNVPYRHLLIGTDNTAACAWVNKGSTTSSSAPAFLLHQLARLRRSHCFKLSALYTPGSSNTVADCCSRMFHLSDNDFLAVMNASFPVQPS
jgi:hypothetical protein